MKLFVLFFNDNNNNNNNNNNKSLLPKDKSTYLLLHYTQ